MREIVDVLNASDLCHIKSSSIAVVFIFLAPFSVYLVLNGEACLFTTQTN
jgi:hypothetical protein